MSHYACPKCDQYGSNCVCPTSTADVYFPMTYRPPVNVPKMDLVKKYREELSANYDALQSLLDSPPSGLNEEELQSLRESRGRKVMTSARMLEAALRGEKLVLRG